MAGDKRGDQRQGQPGSRDSQGARGDAFLKHLEHASSVVRTWPAWKQEILGGTSSQASADKSSQKGGS